MKNEQCLHVFACDASTERVSLLWAVYDKAQSMVECAELEYLCSRARGRSEQFVPSVEHVRSIVGAQYDDLGCICCTIGPGSFTGLRNSLAFVKGLTAARADKAPIKAVGVRTHDAFAYRYSCTARANTPLLVANDARSGHYYATLYPAHAVNNAPKNFDYTNSHIYDYSVNEIMHMLEGYHDIACAGSAAEELAHAIRQKNAGLRLEVLRTACCTAAQAVCELGLKYYEAKKHEITEFSQPLYVRAAL